MLSTSVSITTDGANATKTGTTGSQSYAKTSSGREDSAVNTVAGKTDYKTGATTRNSTDSINSEITSTNVNVTQSHSDTKTSETTVDSSSYKSSSVVNQAGNSGEVSTCHGYFSNSTVGSVKGTTAGSNAAGAGLTRTNSIVTGTDGAKIETQSYVKTDSGAASVANVGSGKNIYTSVATGTEIDSSLGHIRKCDGD